MYIRNSAASKAYRTKGSKMVHTISDSRCPRSDEQQQPRVVTTGLGFSSSFSMQVWAWLRLAGCWSCVASSLLCSAALLSMIIVAVQDSHGCWIHSGRPLLCNQYRAPDTVFDVLSREVMMHVFWLTGSCLVLVSLLFYLLFFCFFYFEMLLLSICCWCWLLLVGFVVPYNRH